MQRIDRRSFLLGAAGLAGAGCAVAQGHVAGGRPMMGGGMRNAVHEAFTVG